MDLLSINSNLEHLETLSTSSHGALVNHSASISYASGRHPSGWKVAGSLQHSSEQQPHQLATLLNGNLLDAPANAISGSNEGSGGVSGVTGNHGEQQRLLQYYSRALLLTILIGVFMFTVNVAIFVALIQKKRKHQLLLQQEQQLQEQRQSQPFQSPKQLQHLQSDCHRDVYIKHSKNTKFDATRHSPSQGHTCEGVHEANAVVDYQVSIKSII